MDAFEQMEPEKEMAAERLLSEEAEKSKRIAMPVLSGKFIPGKVLEYVESFSGQEEHEIARAEYHYFHGEALYTMRITDLQTLAVGTHALHINFTDGYAETSFTVKEKATITSTGDSNKSQKPQSSTSNQSKSKNLKTGDNSNIFLWTVLLFIFGGVAIGCVMAKKKRNEKN